MNTTMHIAIQGGPASFHDTVAREYFSGQSVETVPCDSFPELCQVLEAGKADFAVMAVYNMLAGPLLDNYLLLAQHGLKVVAERWLAIDQTLMALPGQKLEDLQEVWSHPVALQQCNTFISQQPHLKPIETTDTAESARAVMAGKLKGVAAIASRRAAELYGLEVLNGDVADEPNNNTRFLVVARAEVTENVSPTKASVLLPVQAQDLWTEETLELLSANGLEVTLLRTCPSPAPNCILEVETTEGVELASALEVLKDIAPAPQVLGLYTKTPTPVLQDLKDCLPTAQPLSTVLS